ncbi:hypothetical protein [Saccharibacillus kuerlensis]|uniref:Type II secretion system protein GspF domain-containing protein n=1 Tax=Saccharibacillus kuerlensis TaxID=459527 RepID=A0ABQ2L930_9BACL|nr:hypothetical protein [Saccharibacillus kuerlensis]GGO07254.1 hypothetical protein GCM10010969_35560 [Saccharibacillus kuerlensis]
MNLQLLIVLALILYIVPLVLWVILKRRRNHSAVEEESMMNWMSRQPGMKKENPALSRFYQRSYVRSAQIPVFRSQVHRIRQRLAVVSPYDELTLRKETMKITYAVLLIVIGLILALALLGRSIPVVLLGMIGCLVLNGMLIDLFVHRVENRLLKDFRDFLEDNRHQFQSARMADEAIYEASQLAGHDMRLHGERMHEVLTSKDPDRSLSAYYEVAPNRYLKVFTGIARMIMEYGDKTTAKGSLYLNAIGKFVQDINFDLLRRNRLSYQLNSLTIIALMPILLSFPLQRWAEKYFPIMGEFYEGRIGMASKLMLYAVAVAAYVLIRKLAETEESRYMPKSGGIRWEKKMYEYRAVQFVVDRFVPRKNTKAHYSLSKLIKESNSPLMIEWLTLRRLLLGLIAALFVTGMFVSAHVNQVHRIWNAPTYVKGGLMIGRIDGIERQEAECRSEFDRRIMNEIHAGRMGWEDTVRSLVRESGGTTLNEIQQNEAAMRIIEKLVKVNSEYLRWWELLIAAAAGTAAYFIPLGIMRFQRRIRGMEMQNEVDQFRMLISILSQFDRMSVQVILEWMERFAIIFKPALQRCLLDYDGGPARALAALKNEAPFPPFVRLVERLENALERITILEAFDDLEMEQEYYREQKKETMDRLIESKANWGRDIGFAPVMFMLGAYIIVPFLYVSFMQMRDLIAQLSRI